MCKIKGWNPGTVLVTLLLHGLGHHEQRQLWEEKVTWGLAVSEGKSMALMIGIVVEVGRPGARVATKSLYPTHLKQRQLTRNHQRLLKAQNLSPVTFLFQKGHTFQSFPNNSTNGGSIVETYKPIGVFFHSSYP